MTIHLQNSQTKELFVDPAGWTEDPTAATSFKSTIDAWKASRNKGLVNVEILLHFNSRTLDITIPMRDAKAERKAV